MRKPVVVITGAGGEIGHGLIDRLAERGDRRIVTIDISRLEKSIARRSIARSPARSSTSALLERVMAEFEVDLIFHLAALLSTRSEFTPVAAHEVNVEGTLNLLEFAQHEGGIARPPGRLHLSLVDRRLRPARPARRRREPARSREDEYLHPTTMYGCNKLYCELLGDYYARHYKQLAAETASGRVDFRCVRFPGLISALTVPSGGTSDYAPEMIHAAAKGEPYACFVRPDTRIPFMAMPDGVEALLTLAAAPRERLQRTAYNVGAFNPSAEEIRAVVDARVPRRAASRGDRPKRQAIVDSWPADVDDRAARARLGLRAALRLRARVQRIPHPDHWQAVRG